MDALVRIKTSPALPVYDEWMWTSWILIPEEKHPHSTSQNPQLRVHSTLSVMVQRVHDGLARGFVGASTCAIYSAFAPRLLHPYLQYVHHLSWLLFWGTRHAEDPTRWEDLILFSLFYFPRTIVLSFWALFRSLLFPLAGLVGLALFSLTAIALLRARPVSKSLEWKDYDCTHPLVLRCRTTHTRMFPKKHAFSYYYLQISIPVGFKGTCGSLVSVETTSNKSWLHVRAEDYLQRDSPLTTLRGKLSAYLQSQV